MTTDSMRDLAGLRLFVLIAEIGSLSKAAQATGTTQPVISRRLAAIEMGWGGRLLHRTGRGVMLTELGERALPMVRALLEQADGLAEAISQTKALPSGTVRIATLPSLAYIAVPPLLDHIRSKGLKITIEIIEGSSAQVEGWHADDRSDLSFLYRHGRLPNHESPLAAAPFCLIGRTDDPRLDTDVIPFKELDGLPIAMPPRPDNSRMALEREFRRVGIDFNVPINVASLPLLTLVAQQPGHYTLLPAFTVADAIGLGRVKAVPIGSPVFTAVIAAGRPLHRPLSGAGAEILKVVDRVIRDAIPG
jgi:LysR family nitrogen assimilation transcriptional regulator